MRFIVFEVLLGLTVVRSGRFYGVFNILNLKFLWNSFEFDALDLPSRIILWRNRLYITSIDGHISFFVIVLCNLLVLLDLSAAFDTVDHVTLLRALHKSRLVDEALEWL